MLRRVVVIVDWMWLIDCLLFVCCLFVVCLLFDGWCWLLVVRCVLFVVRCSLRVVCVVICIGAWLLRRGFGLLVG